MKNLEKVSLFLTKFCEVLHWTLVDCLLVCLVVTLTALLPDVSLEDAGEYAGVWFSLYGLDVMPVGPEGDIHWTALYLLLAGLVLICGMTALIFRLANRIIRQSRQDSPFCPENLARLRRLGLLTIAIPVTKVIVSVIVTLADGANAATISLHLDQFSLGLAVLCLTQYFARGAALEQDMDGLV